MLFTLFNETIIAVEFTPVSKAIDSDDNHLILSSSGTIHRLAKLSRCKTRLHIGIFTFCRSRCSR
jgi:hypothetical protein